MNQTFDEICAAADRLPLKLKRQLTKRLLATTIVEASATVVYLKRLSPQKLSRLHLLMDKNNEGRLTMSERTELKKLGAEVDRIMLENSRTLAQTVRPELFDEHGRRIKNDATRAGSRTALERTRPKRIRMR